MSLPIPENRQNQLDELVTGIMRAIHGPRTMGRAVWLYTQLDCLYLIYNEAKQRQASERLRQYLPAWINPATGYGYAISIEWVDQQKTFTLTYGPQFTVRAFLAEPEAWGFQLPELVFDLAVAIARIAASARALSTTSAIRGHEATVCATDVLIDAEDVTICLYLDTEKRSKPIAVDLRVEDLIERESVGPDIDVHGLLVDSLAAGNEEGG